MPGTCFVVMGYGRKTDYATGRVLDLNATYEGIIKPAVTDAGLDCIRADEIVHSGVIDVPMYQQLLTADVVIADLSTANPNALYELGVRHALRPYATIVLAEAQMTYPFDLNHTVIRRYQHLGEDIGVREATRLRAELAEAIRRILAQRQDDSPVYTYLRPLAPPRLGAVPVAADDGPSPAADEHAQSVATLLGSAEQSIRSDQFAAAIPLLQAARALRPSDPQIVQRLVLATYKSKRPTPLQALQHAHALLAALSPEISTDPETLGLEGAIRKRLWEETSERPHLDRAIFSYEKGFYLKNDYYNGINLAYLLNVRAAVSPPAEAIADFVQAERVRRHVLRVCEALLADTERKLTPENRYWVLATMAEAALGIGDEAGHAHWMIKASETAPPGWMRASTTEQLGKLRGLLADSPLRFIGNTDGAVQI